MAKGRTLKEFYCFINDAANNYCTVSYSNTGTPIINKSQSPFPLRYSPKNFNSFKPSFGTNRTYVSGTRGVTNPFLFVEDGADILRSFDYSGEGYAQELYFRVLRYNFSDGKMYLYYLGRFDFSTKNDNPIKGYTINVVDYGVWGVLSQFDTVDFQIDCSSSNPAAIPVLLDGITLKAIYTYQTVSASMSLGFISAYLIINLALVNTDGDSFGVVTQGQTGFVINPFGVILPNRMVDYAKQGFNYFYKTVYADTITVSGTVLFDFLREGGGLPTFCEFYIYRSTDTVEPQALPISRRIGYFVYSNTGQHERSSFTFSETIDLQSGEYIYFVLYEHTGVFLDEIHVNFDVSNIKVQSNTRINSSIAYSLRPLDLLQQLVNKATLGKFTANSLHFTDNDTLVATCGNAIRNAPNAYIKTNVRDWFKSYDSRYWLAFRIINGQFWVELFTTVYDDSSILFDIGEIKEVQLVTAEEYLLNEIEVGSPKQDYRHPSGRLEFNTTNTFSAYQLNVKRKLSLVSVYRKDCYGISFMALDYQQGSTQDNSGDDSVFLIDIVNEKSTQGVPVENFVDITVNNTPTAPVIHYPFNNDTIMSLTPNVSGFCQPLTVVNIYVDGSFDGSVTSDVNGNWSYDIVSSLTPFVTGVTSGVHTIESTFSDLSGTTDSKTVLVIGDIQQTSIQIPSINQNLYDNKPLINGFGNVGDVLQILLDGINIGTVTVNQSCRWFFKMPIMSNGDHTITVGGVSVPVSVNSFTTIPLITSFSDGFQIRDNLPLVEGVGTPGAKVNLWLNYYPDVSIGTAFVDVNGNWSIQIVPLFQADNLTILTPIPNGDNILSTDLIIQSAIINITGYKLNRPDYDSMSGVIDNTVFNTEITPKHDLISRMRFFKSVFDQQPDTVIKFESGDKNQQFSTTLNGITIKENDDLQINKYNDKPLFLPIILKAKVNTPISFVETMDNFSSGGLIQCDYQGSALFALPIGEMTVQDVSNDIQDWNLLLSAKTPLTTLLKLSTLGLNFVIMNNAVFRSDYNTMHFVSYDFTKSPKYKTAEMYEDWFENRNFFWIHNPIYVQKIQTTDPIIKDQIVTNGATGGVLLNIYRCKNASLVDSIIYNVVSPQPIPLPDVVMEASIDWSSYETGQYFCVLYANGVPFAISERIETSEEFEDTILIESSSAKNKTGVYFSTGFSPYLRLEGMVEKLQPSIDTIIDEDESGDFKMQHAINTRKRTILLGNPSGIPDYIAIKAASLMTLDNCLVEGVAYVLDKGASFDPQDKVAGHPLYFYSVDVEPQENQQGVVLNVQQGDFRSSVILVVDAGAFGMGGGGFIEIDLNNE